MCRQLWSVGVGIAIVLFAHLGCGGSGTTRPSAPTPAPTPVSYDGTWSGNTNPPSHLIPAFGFRISGNSIVRFWFTVFNDDKTACSKAQGFNGTTTILEGHACTDFDPCGVPSTPIAIGADGLIDFTDVWVAPDETFERRVTGSLKSLSGDISYISRTFPVCKGSAKWFVTKIS